MPVTIIPGTEYIGDSRSRINDNFSALSLEKQDLNLNLTALSGILTDGYLQKTGSTWNTIPSIPSSWGSITGTLTSQTDLNTALTGKQNSNANLTAISGISANGYLQKSGSVWSVGVLPAPTWGSITGTLTSQVDLNTALTGKQNSNANLTAISGISANGYLQKSGSVWSVAVLPAPTWGSIVGTLTSQTDLNTALTNKQDSNANLTEIGLLIGDGYLQRNGSVWSVGVLPAPTWGSITGTLTSQVDLNTALTGKQDSNANLTEIGLLVGDGTPLKTGSSWSLISGASGISLSLPFTDINIIPGKFVEMNNLGELVLATSETLDKVIGLVVSVNSGIATILSSGISSLLIGTAAQELYLGTNGDGTFTSSIPAFKNKLVYLGSFVGFNIFNVNIKCLGVG